MEQLNNFFKKVLPVLLTLNTSLFTCFAVFPQGAAINTTATPADPSAILDVSSSNSGILIPRLTKLQRSGISQPAEGLMIYQTDDTTGFWYYNGTSWQQIGTAPGAAISAGTSVGNTLYWNGTSWVESSNIYNTGGSVGIGTNNPEPTALIDMSSSTKGTLITRMTTAERNAIVNPAQGLQIFNISSNCMEVYIGSNWQSIICGCVSAPNPPSATNHIIGSNYIAWMWSPVNGASGYKYNTINDFNSSIDNGNNILYVQTGLVHSNNYNLYVWAYNNCGNSSANQLIASTAYSTACGTVTFNYNGTNVTYGTVNGQNGTCWLDRNLGASVVASSFNHLVAYGDLFQWGRLSDGHQLRSNSNSTTTTSSNTVPGHNNFIKGSTNWYSGTSPAPDALWQGISGVNNPCPSGWRLPTSTEFENERNAWSGGNNYWGAIQSPLKLTAAGRRDYTDAVIYDEGAVGLYWYSTLSGPYACYLHFDGANALLYIQYRAGGLSVRCIKD